MATRYTGAVKSFKGQWGFLVADGVEGDIFLHVKDSPAINNVVLKVGESIEFDLTSGGPNGQARAINASRLDGGGDADVGGGATLTGTVKSFRRGWGLIDSPSVEGALFFGERDNPQCQEGSLLPGDEVTFELGTNPTDGRSKAINVRVAVRDQSECVGMRVRGAVKSFQDGWGFATSTRFQGTILLGRKQVSAAGIGLQVGEPVEFEVSVSPNGKHEAINITKVGMALPAAMPGRAPLALMNGGNAGVGARDRSRTPFGGAAPGQGQYVGTVKRFMDGWGFLVCDQLPGDIYVKMRDSPNLTTPLQQGEAVSFDLVYRNASEKNNGATAANVQRLGGGGGMAAAPRMALPAPQQQQQPWQGKGAGTPRPAAAQGGQHTGTLVQFKPAPDNWGWVESPTCNGQVFFGLRDNPQLQTPPKVGDTLVFELGAGPKGRSKAINVTASMVGQRVQGVMRSIKDGGFGFAEVADIAGNVMVGKKALHSSGLDISMFQVGDSIDFEVNMTPKGYEAVNIRKY